MQARIPLPSGDYALADYRWNSHTWEIDHGIESVYVPPGESAFGALKKVYPSAETGTCNSR
jgi:hypothetical protein